MDNTGLKRVALYARVSSENQRERETIRTQLEALAKRLADDPTVGKITRSGLECVFTGPAEQYGHNLPDHQTR